MCDRDKLITLLRIFEARAQAQNEAKRDYIRASDYVMAAAALGAELIWERAAAEVRRVIGSAGGEN